MSHSKGFQPFCRWLRPSLFRFSASTTLCAVAVLLWAALAGGAAADDSQVVGTVVGPFRKANVMDVYAIKVAANAQVADRDVLSVLRGDTSMGTAMVLGVSGNSALICPLGGFQGSPRTGDTLVFERRASIPQPVDQPPARPSSQMAASVRLPLAVTATHVLDVPVQNPLVAAGTVEATGSVIMRNTGNAPIESLHVGIYVNGTVVDEKDFDRIEPGGTTQYQWLDYQSNQWTSITTRDMPTVWVKVTGYVRGQIAWTRMDSTVQMQPTVRSYSPGYYPYGYPYGQPSGGGFSY